MDELSRWRKEFPILERVIHVGNCSQSPQATRVRSAINDYLDSWLHSGMDWDFWCEEVVRAKAEFAKLINADVSEIAVCSSVSEATAAVIGSLTYNPGQGRLVASEAEFPTVGHVLLANRKWGWRIDYVPVENGRVELEQYDRIIDNNTALTAVTHVYYQNGFKQDIDAITRIAQAKGSLVLIDAYQSAGTVPLDVKACGADFLMTGNLKYLLGMPGIAFLYVKKELIPGLNPALTGWFGQENPFSFKVRVLDYARDARRFDTGTPPVVNAFAARAGMEIINEVGVANIWRHIRQLSEACTQTALAKGLTVASPLDPEQKGSTTAILVPDAHGVEAALKKRGIIAAARGEMIRIAPHFFTTREDIEATLDNLVAVLSSKEYEVH